LIIINLWGGPGCGKSTTATGLFSLMKMRGHKVELVTEYAKELTYDNNWDMLTKQELIFPEQYRRQKRLAEQVDYVITDSPLPLNIIYAREDLKKDDQFKTEVINGFNEFNNFNIMY
jgi:ABC-type oligopeptide transport system ATPase subunit